MNLRDVIKKIANDNEEVYSIPCTVKSVSGKTCDVEPLNGDADILGVKLQANDTTEGILFVPSVGSIVIVSFENKDNAFVSMWSEIESIQLRGDSFGGLIKIDSLITKINNIETDINNLKTALGGWVVAPGDGGTALKTALTTYISQPITNTTKSDLENDKVKHG